MAEYILTGKDLRGSETLEKHADWYDTFRDNYTFTAENVEGILQEEIGKVFVKVLEDAGVYKCTEEGRAAFGPFHFSSVRKLRPAAAGDHGKGGWIQ